MAQEGFKRKLTAILSADVEGYSRLMGDDEEATVRTLKSYREVLTTLIKQHNGKVLDSPGDNLLAEFASMLPDDRNADYIEFSRLDQLKQRVYLMMQGYEDCNDQEKLQNDPVIQQVISNKLCSQPTLCRFENSMDKHDIWALCNWFAERYVSGLPSDCKEVILDVDSTDDPTHGAATSENRTPRPHRPAAG